MLTSYYSISFTGNRPKDEPGRFSEDIDAIYPRLLEIFKNLISQADRKEKKPILLCGIAAGADTLAMEAAYHLNLAVHLVFPFSQQLNAQSYKAVFKNEFTGYPYQIFLRTERIINLLKTRKEVETTFRWTDTSHSEASPYVIVNEYLLERADLLISLTNGRVTGLSGGASEMEQEAENRQIPLIPLRTTPEDIL